MALTPLAITIRIATAVKQATEEQLNGLEATRRLLLRVEAR